MSNLDTIEMHTNTIQHLSFVALELPQSIVKSIKSEIDTITKSNFTNKEKLNDYLAGAIDHEYRLTESCDEFEIFVNNLIPSYCKLTGILEAKNKKVKFSCLQNSKKEFWVNFQKKNEYNPLHSHSGNISFVIWIDIPYDRKDEINLPQFKLQRTTDHHAAFIFRYPQFTIRGGIGSYCIPMDKTFEGKMIMFPSYLMHEVTPFYTSDNYRVSVSGNLTFAED